MTPFDSDTSDTADTADISDAADPTLPTTSRKREADEWALVLVAEGLHPRIILQDRVFGLEVEPGEVDDAFAILKAWQLERRERRRRFALPAPRSASAFETAAAYALALGLLAFHLGLEAAGRGDALRKLGASQAAMVLEGQPWRLVTALTLHADLPHVLGNTLLGGLFLAAVAGRLGIGFALLAFVTSGTLGNLANALYYTSAHSSIGASTGVFGLVGVLAGLAAWQRHRTAPPGRGAWVPLGAGLAIVAMLGSGGPKIDFTAHLFGLAAGGGTGFLIAAPFALRPRPGRLAQTWAAGIALALLFGAWAMADSWAAGVS